MARVEKRRIKFELPIMKPTTAPASKEESKKEESKKGHKLVPRSTKGWWDVVNTSGEVLNDKALRKQEAQVIMDKYAVK